MSSGLPSFRDPAGRLYFVDDIPLRQVHAAYATTYRDLLASPFLASHMAEGTIVPTRVLDEQDAAISRVFAEGRHGISDCGDGDLFLMHEAIPFPSYPAEWPFAMLCSAARLTLDIAEHALEHGIGIKDATPYNVLFKGPRPVFVDILSFERRDPRDAIWLAHGQFMRTFMLPLLACAHLKLPLSGIFLSRRDGIEPVDLYTMLGPLKRLKPPFLGAVTLPAWLSGRADGSGSGVYRRHHFKDHEKARFVMRSLFRRLRRAIAHTGKHYGAARTVWSDYCQTCTYDERAFAEKGAFVDQFLRERRPRRVLDVGSNTGYFSEQAASLGASVVAIDSDSAVVNRLWRRAGEKRLNILPLVVDFARPTPALGWRNAETLPFLARAKGHFDALFMLAVLHHLLVTDQIPLHEILALAAEITTRYLIIEYVAPEDPQFRRLARGRDDLYRYLTKEVFEAHAARHFRIVHSQKISDQMRWIYLMETSHAT